MAGRVHLAQINIARMRAPLDDPRMAEFVAQLEAVNAAADASPGFVWRLQSDDGDATALRVFDDPNILINLSVWESVDALHRYVYGRAHRRVLQRRQDWFERMARAHLALWWIPAGHIPSVEDAKQRLDRVAELGATPQAFTFRKRFLPAQWGGADSVRTDGCGSVALD